MCSHMNWQVHKLGRDQESIAMWDRYILDSPTSTGYHLTGWREVVERAFGHQAVYLFVRDGSGDIKGVLPLIMLASRLFGRFLVSMPFLNYGGIDTSEQDAANL